MTLEIILTASGQVVVLAAAVLGYLSTRQKIGRESRSTRRQVGQVHKLVNDQLDRQLIYNGKLATALTEAGEPVPPQDPKPPDPSPLDSGNTTS